MKRWNLLLLVALAGVPTRVPAEDQPEVRVYFGNLHSHTGLSDGTGTPAEAFAYARDVGRLDFLAITEHNHLLGGNEAAPAERTAAYDHLLAAADQADAPGRFVAFAGQEYSSISKGNHVNVFDVRQVVDVPNGAFDQLLTWRDTHRDSTGAAAVLQLNHPEFGGKKDGPLLEYGRDDFGDERGWITRMGGAASLLEVLNGEPPAEDPSTRAPQVMEASYQRFLRLGFHVAPTGNQDNHRANWGTATTARTAVLSPALTREGVLTALRQRHVYATEDADLELVFRVDGHLMGDVVPSATPRELAIDLRLLDRDEPDAAYVVELLAGGIEPEGPTIAATWEARGDGRHTWKVTPRAASGERFFYFRVTQRAGSSEDRAWTAPIWYAPPVGAGG